MLAALVVYGLVMFIALIQPHRGRGVLLLGIALHALALLARGVAIGYVPLSNKMESFAGASLSLAVVAAIGWRPKRAFLLPMIGLAAAALGAALSFDTALRWPFPLLRTIWYPLHVPLSFITYAIWTAGAAEGLCWWRERRPEQLARVEYLSMLGFGLWSVSMIFGGIWGAVSWGAWFLWDPKFIWTLILWFHYASFMHLRLTPSLADAEWLRVVMAWLGFLYVLVAYVGTSFFFGGSTHAF